MTQIYLAYLNILATSFDYRLNFLLIECIFFDIYYETGDLIDSNIGYLGIDKFPMNKE